MSLPGPLTYEAKRFGSDREAPTKQSMRPYSDRLRLSDELVEKSRVKSGSVTDSLLTAAQLVFFLGAVAPIIVAIPGFGSLFDPIGAAAGPAGGGPSAYSVLAGGWWGALLVVVAGAAGVVVARIAAWSPEPNTPETRFVRFLAVGVTVIGAALLMLGTAPAGANAGSIGGALVMIGSVSAIYGLWCVARRENWLRAVGAAAAVFTFTSLLFGAVALVLLMVGGRAFPGQVVARHPWKRTEVALEPIAAPPEIEAAPDAGLHPMGRPPRAEALFLAKLLLVFGAFAPFVLALPWFGIALFGDLILAAGPYGIAVLWTGASLQASFIVLSNPGTLGALVPAAVFTVFWLLLLPAAGAIIAGRAVAARKRRWAALAGGILLVVGGRPIFGVAALLAIGHAWALFDVPDMAAGPTEAEEESAKDSTHGVSAH